MGFDGLEILILTLLLVLIISLVLALPLFLEVERSAALGFGAADEGAKAALYHVRSRRPSEGTSVDWEMNCGW